MIPKYLDIVEHLPVLTSGKVDRKQLPAPFNLLKGTSRDVVAPESDIECVMVQAWEKCLQVSPVSVEDDFFLDLSGHSLLAARVVTELRTRLGTSRISVRDHLQVQNGPGDVGAPAAARHRCARAGRRRYSDARDPGRAGVCHRAGLGALDLRRSAGIRGGGLYGIVAAPVRLLGARDHRASCGGSIEFDTALWLTTGLALRLLAGPAGIEHRPQVAGDRALPAGPYPVWSLYYFRWWLVNRFQGFSWAHMFVGTPLMGLYYRAMGAKVGRNATISTVFCSAFDLVTIGERSQHRRRDAYPRAFASRTACSASAGSTSARLLHRHPRLPRAQHPMGAGARLDDMSALVDGTHLRRGEGRRGSPVRAGRGGGAHAGRRRARASAHRPLRRACTPH